MDNNKTNLILSDEFEKALVSAAEIKNNNISMCKTRNKDNYIQFYELMLASRRDIQSILDMRKKNRTDDDNNKVKVFKKEVSATYKQVCDLLIPEELEDGEPSKIQKMVQKITSVLKMLDYLGDNRIEEEFKKSGIELKYKKLSEEEVFSQSHIKENVECIFNNGKNIKEDINKNNEEIKTNIYENSVPSDLQFDKSMNPTGIKSSDFCKLVDLKAKLLQAQDDDTKEKISEKASDMAGDYLMQNRRNELLNQKLNELAAPDQTEK
jgi:hypothetical protein